jgi:hypothetical protein
MTWFGTDSRSALEARGHAQWIAFAPGVFQAARVLCSSGLLAHVEAAGPEGLTLEAAISAGGWPPYSTRLLLEAGLGMGIVTLKNGRYAATKAAWFLLHDPMTRANMEFMHEVNYRGYFELEAALRTQEPRGLASLGPWSTVYESLSALPPATRDAWLAFDHYYSDLAFPAAWPLVRAHGVHRLLDIGGNTGKFAKHCVTHDSEVEVTIVDLPGQLGLARQALASLPPADVRRVRFHEANLLQTTAALPSGHDAIWMSQFLACFSESEIVSIFERCVAALAPGGKVFVLEPFWDRQGQQAAEFCLQQTSLYFAAIANGKGRIYTSDVLIALARRAGLEVESETDGIATTHTLLACRRA